MNNQQKYDRIFLQVFNADPSTLGPAFNKQNLPDWDSVHQLNIMSLLEEAFDIFLDPEDVMALTSYDNGIRVLRKYGIEL